VMTDAQKPVFDDSDSAYISDEDSPEMKQLKKEERSQSHEFSEDGTLKVPSVKSATLKSAEAMLQSDYTVADLGSFICCLSVNFFKVIVIDEKFLLKNQDVFELLVERRWSVVVPHSGIIIAPVQSILHSLIFMQSLPA
jgi:hypothetical protein